MRKKPGGLGCVRDYTTQLYKDYNGLLGILPSYIRIVMVI